MRPSYKRAINWIAENDEPEMESEELREHPLVSLYPVAEGFDVPLEKVIEDVIRIRRKNLGIDKTPK